MALTAAIVGMVMSSQAYLGSGVAEPNQAAAPTDSTGVLDSLGRRLTESVDGFERAVAQGLAQLEYICVGRYRIEFN